MRKYDIGYIGEGHAKNYHLFSVDGDEFHIEIYNDPSNPRHEHVNYVGVGLNVEYNKNTEELEEQYTTRRSDIEDYAEKHFEELLEMMY